VEKYKKLYMIEKKKVEELESSAEKLRKEQADRQEMVIRHATHCRHSRIE